MLACFCGQAAALGGGMCSALFTLSKSTSGLVTTFPLVAAVRLAAVLDSIEEGGSRTAGLIPAQFLLAYSLLSSQEHTLDQQ